MPSAQPLIAAKQISHQFNGKTVLQNISFELYANQILTLIGPNGAGKSTLLKILLKLLPPTKGAVYQQPSCRIGYMPQKIHIEPSFPMTLERFLYTKKPMIAGYGQTIIDDLELNALLQRPLQGLSGGEMQRALLARALMNQPQLLVLDEPTQGVDLQGQAQLYHYLSEIRHRLQCGILIVSHDLHIVMKNTDQVICLNQQICCSGAPQDISQNPEFKKIFGDEIHDISIYEHHHTAKCHSTPPHNPTP